MKNFFNAFLAVMNNYWMAAPTIEKTILIIAFSVLAIISVVWGCYLAAEESEPQYIAAGFKNCLFWALAGIAYMAIRVQMF